MGVADDPPPNCCTSCFCIALVAGLPPDMRHYAETAPFAHSGCRQVGRFSVPLLGLGVAVFVSVHWVMGSGIQPSSGSSGASPFRKTSIGLRSSDQAPTDAGGKARFPPHACWGQTIRDPTGWLVSSLFALVAGPWMAKRWHPIGARGFHGEARTCLGESQATRPYRILAQSQRASRRGPCRASCPDNDWGAYVVALGFKCVVMRLRGGGAGQSCARGPRRSPGLARGTT